MPVLHYENSNIYPKAENDKRFEMLKKVADHFALELIRTEYNHQKWLEFVKGLEKEPEHGARCLKCFEYNLCCAREVATLHGIESFTTTLTVSRFKNSKDIFEVGKKFAGFVDIDFKKKDGFAKSKKMSEELGLYRQQYCGCEFSKKGDVKCLTNSKKNLTKPFVLL